MTSEADVTGYGGAAGGGKSDLLNGVAHTRHTRALILRRKGVDADYLYERGCELAPERAHKNSVKREIRHAGRVTVYGGMKDVDSWKSHRGKPWDFLGFDEGEEFLETQFRALMGWNRTTIKKQRVRAIIAFNPPTTPEGYWIIDYFGPWLDPQHSNPAKPGELRWFVTIDGKDTEVASADAFDHNGEMLFPRSRTFIPSFVEDNPHLMATNYVSALNALPEPLRSQLRHGDFSVGLDDDIYQVCPTAWVKAAQDRWTEDGGRDCPMSAVGVDPARGGRDETILARRRGDWYDELMDYPGGATPDGPTVAGIVVAAVRDGAPIAVDVIGIGSSVYDHLKHIPGTVAVNNSSGATGCDKSGMLKFFNLRTEQAWRFREALDPANNRAVALPKDRKLLADLTALRFSHEGRTLKIESKDSVVRRLGRSPDRGDAVIMALPDYPSAATMHGAFVARTQIFT